MTLTALFHVAVAIDIAFVTQALFIRLSSVPAGTETDSSVIRNAALGVQTASTHRARIFTLAIDTSLFSFTIAAGAASNCAARTLA